MTTTPPAEGMRSALAGRLAEAGQSMKSIRLRESGDLAGN